MTKEKPEHYVNNKEFHALLVENKKLDEGIELLSKDKESNKLELNLLLKKQKKIQNEIGKIFLNICKKYLTKPNLIKYTWDRKDEMISDATYFMSRYMRRFDVEKKNPFAYFTQACKNAFLQNINKRKKIESKFQSLGYIEQLFIKDNQGSPEEWE
jgi:hypothetical protein